MSCRDKIAEFLGKIEKDRNAVSKDVPPGKELKFDDSQITESMIVALLDGKTVDEQAVSTITDLMGPLSTKLNGIKDINLANISTYVNAVKDPNKVVQYNIALKELLDTQKAEYDKFQKTDDVKKVTEVSDDGVMNVGLARSASVIGRKYLYTLGYRFKATNYKVIGVDKKGKEIREYSILSPLAVEKKYNEIGMSILKDMEKDGLVELGRGRVIDDYYKQGQVGFDKDKKPTIETNIARPILSSLVTEKEFTEHGDSYKKQLRGEMKEATSPTMANINAMISSINHAKIPPMMSKPLDESVDMEMQAKNDAIGVTKTGAEFRDILHSNPVYINDKVIPYFMNLAKQWKDSKVGFPAFIKNISEQDDQSMLNIFGVTPASKFSDEISDSVVGQNRSKLNPLEDFLEQIESFSDGDKALELYMNYNLVKNSRFNMDNSVGNTQTSKYNRHMMGSGTNTVDLNDPDVARHFTDSIIDQHGELAIKWGIDPDLKGQEKASAVYDVIAGNVENKELDMQLKYYKKMLDSKNGKTQAIAIANFKSDGNMMATIDTLGAIYDLREGFKTGTVTTNYNTKSDATASGGSITSSASVGYGEAAMQVLEQLGFISGKNGTIDDIYALLSNRLTSITDVQEEGTTDDVVMLTPAQKRKSKGLAEFLDVVYNGNMRDLSKDPTMTFVYNQGRNGAIQTIAQNVTERLIKNLASDNKDTRNKTQEYIGNVLELDHAPTIDELFNRPDMKNELIVKLRNKDGIIPFIHSQLMEAVDPIIKDRKAVILNLYAAVARIRGTKGVHILPPLAKFDGVKNTEANRKEYGMPLTKTRNILHTSDKGDLITMEERANPTSAVVNTTHAQDMAIAARSLIDAVAAFKDKYPGEKVPGVSFVHDEFITSSKLGVLIDKHYVVNFAKVIGEYSVEQELLDLLKELDPESSLITKYEPVIQAANKTKKAAMDRFTKDSGKVYGNTKGTYEIMPNKKPTPPKGPKPGKPKEKVETRKENKSTGADYRSNDAKAADAKVAELRSMIETDPESVITYDLETTGFLNQEGTDILQIGIKTGTSKAININVKLLQSDAEAYIDRMKGGSIEGTPLYEEIRKAADKNNGMADWNVNAVSKAEAIKQTKEAFRGRPNIVSYNGVSFDDKFLKDRFGLDVTTKYDMQFLVNTPGTRTTNYHGKRKGSLGDKARPGILKNAHTAAADVEATFALAYKQGRNEVYKATDTQALPEVIVSAKELADITSANKEYKGKVVEGDSFQYDPETMVITVVKPSESNDVTEEEYQVYLAHEIRHALTAEWVANPDNSKEVATINSAIGRAIKEIRADLTYEDSLLMARLAYAANQSNGHRSTAEIIAILSSEPNIRSQFLKHFPPKDKSLIDRVIDKVKEFLGLNGTLDLTEMVSTIDSIVAKGKEPTVAVKGSPLGANFKDEPTPPGFDPARNYTKVEATAPEVVMGRSVNMLNNITRNLIIDNAERVSTGAFKSIDAFLDRAFPLYADARARVLGLYNESGVSPALQELSHYMSLSSFKGKDVKQDMLSFSHNLKEEHNAREHKYLSKIADLTSEFTKEGKEELYDLVTKVPLHNYFRYDTDLKTLEDVDAEITKLVGKLSKHDNDIVTDTVHMLVTGEVKRNSVYNLSQFDENTSTHNNIEKLIALKAMKKSNTTRKLFQVRAQYPELYTTMKDNSMALYSLSMKLHNMSPRGVSATHTLVKEPFKQRQVLKAITESDRKLYDSGELLGWRIIKEPTADTPGVVVKTIQDDTFTEGASLMNDLPDHDVNVPSHVAEKYDLVKANILSVGDRYKMILTPEQKKDAGLVKDMGVALVKSAANVIAADDAQYARNKIMEPSLRSVITSNDDKEVIDDILGRMDDDIIDHPWVLKLEKGVKFDELPKKIRDKYKPIQQRLSGINGLDKDITHVRKDIRHWLIGGHHPSLFKNPTLQKISKGVKELVAGAKIGMIMLNPVKLVKDEISNDMQLSMLGVPTSTIAMYKKDILKSVDSFNKIKNAMFEAKFKYKSNPTEATKTRYEKLQAMLKENDLYTAYSNGFMSSISSDILNSNVDTAEGLQADIHKSLKYLLTDKHGNKNTLHEIISNSSRFGMDGSDVLRGIGKVVNNFNTEGESQRYLDGVADRLNKIKKDDDMVKFLAQFTVSPDAETVKAGTWLNDFMDMSMRETYRRWLIDQGVKPDKAVEKAVAMAPFYPEDMPIGLKMLSDLFIIPFPSFSFRTPAAANYLLRNKIGNVAIAEGLQSITGVNAETYFGAHPFNMLIEDRMLQMPGAPIGVNSILPTNIFNFGQ